MAESIFGIHAVTSVLQRRPDSVQELLVLDGRSDKRLKELLALASRAGIAVSERPRPELDRLAAGGRHQGVVAQLSAAAAFTEGDIPAILDAAGPAPLILILDGVTDPHNLGACLRSADAAGVCMVLAPKDNAAAITPTVRKVACGAAEVVPFIPVSNLARAIKQLQELGVWVVGLAGEAEQTLFTIDLRGAIAIVMGAEGQGMRRLTREHCDFLARLPMAGSVSSLNVSVATGISLFEAQRQRLSAGVG